MNPQVQAPVPRSESTPPLRLLIAEDNAVDRDLVVLELARAGIRGTQTHVENRQQFEATMVPGAFDAIISDYRFPDWTGMDAFTFANSVDAEVPFLL
jgi:CheY-like chemotaxis protein